MRDYRFHCEDCDSYSQCQYYHNRKGTSLICKEFQYGSSVIEQIRAEIEELQQDVLKSSETPLDSAYNISIGISMALGVIDKYTKGEQK